MSAEAIGIHWCDNGEARIKSLAESRQHCYIYPVIKVAIDKSLLTDESRKAAFSIVKGTVEKSLKKFEKDIEKEGGSVTVTITGPGTYDVAMDNLSLKLRRKISSASKKMFAG